jgi:hypothetical protein
MSYFYYFPTAFPRIKCSMKTIRRIILFYTFPMNREVGRSYVLTRIETFNLLKVSELPVTQTMLKVYNLIVIYHCMFDGKAVIIRYRNTNVLKSTL